MKLSHLLTAAAGAALVAGAAQAQVQTQTHSPPQAGPDRTTAADTSVNPPAPDAPAANTPAPAATDTDVTAPVSASTTTYDQGAQVTTTTVSNGPVPDTAENRAKYGQPLSQTGRKTAARGN